jgi:hypothetical protein
MTARAPRQPRLTVAKCQRAIDAIVAVVEASPDRNGTDWDLEKACDRLRELMEQAAR